MPHLPQDGKVVSFTTRSHTAREIASGAPLLVDVEYGPHHRLYALSQGHFHPIARKAHRPTRTPVRCSGSTPTAP